MEVISASFERTYAIVFFLFRSWLLRALLAAMSMSVSVWALLCVLVRAGVGMNTDCDVLGVLGCCFESESAHGGCSGWRKLRKSRPILN